MADYDLSGSGKAAAALITRGVAVFLAGFFVAAYLFSRFGSAEAAPALQQQLREMHEDIFAIKCFLKLDPRCPPTPTPPTVHTTRLVP